MVQAGAGAILTTDTVTVMVITEATHITTEELQLLRVSDRVRV